jgi:uncharacterized membrane protein YgcG
MSEQNASSPLKRSNAIGLVVMGTGMFALYHATTFSSPPVCPPVNLNAPPLTVEQRLKQPACRSARSGRSGSWSSGSSSSSNTRATSTASRGGFGGHGASSGG